MTRTSAVESSTPGYTHRPASETSRTKPETDGPHPELLESSDELAIQSQPGKIHQQKKVKITPLRSFLKGAASPFVSIFQAFKHSPIKTTLIATALIGLMATFPALQLVAGGALILSSLTSFITAGKDKKQARKAGNNEAVNLSYEKKGKALTDLVLGSLSFLKILDPALKSFNFVFKGAPGTAGASMTAPQRVAHFLKLTQPDQTIRPQEFTTFGEVGRWIVTELRQFAGKIVNPSSGQNTNIPLLSSIQKAFSTALELRNHPVAIAGLDQLDGENGAHPLVQKVHHFANNVEQVVGFLPS